MDLMHDLQVAAREEPALPPGFRVTVRRNSRIDGFTLTVAQSDPHRWANVVIDRRHLARIGAERVAKLAVPLGLRKLGVET